MSFSSLQLVHKSWLDNFSPKVRIRKPSNVITVHDDTELVYAAMLLHPPIFKNLGNTCYASALLQAMFANPVFESSWKSEAHAKKHLYRNDCGYCLMQKLWNAKLKERVIDRHDVELLYVLFRWDDAEQKDADEGYIALLEEMEKKDSNLNKGYSSIKELLFCDIRTHKREVGKRTDFETPTHEFRSTLHTPVQASYTDLGRVLASYFGVDNRTLTVANADKRFAYEDSFINAYTLVITLKLASFNNITKQNGKITTPETLRPTETIDLIGLVDVDVENFEFHPIYTLFAIICHRGTTSNSGHYIAYVCIEKQWWYCNDAPVTVIKVEIKDVLKQEAYMLFYTKLRR